MSNPFITRPGVMERGTHLAHLCLRDGPQVVGYQFWGHRTVNDAYGDPPDSGVSGAGPAAMFEVARGAAFRSPSLRRSGRGQIVGSIRGQTHVAFDPDDFAGPVAGLSPIPPDDHWMFLRVQENRMGPGLLALPGVAESTVTLNGVLAGDEVAIKGLVFQFQAGANNLGGRTGAPGLEFIVGLGAGDAAAGTNLAAALNDNGDVSPAMDLIAPLNLHTFGTDQGGGVVLIQPENGAAVLVRGSQGEFSITTSDAGRLVLDGGSVAAGTFTWAPDAATPVLGPIFGLPPATHFVRRDPSFTLQATAPSGTGSVAGGLPNLSDDLASAAPRAMHLVFPGWLLELSIRNISGVNLLVSFGPGQAMRNVAASTQFYQTSGWASTKEVILACPDGVAGADFTFHAVSQTEM